MKTALRARISISFLLVLLAYLLGSCNFSVFSPQPSATPPPTSTSPPTPSLPPPTLAPTYTPSPTITPTVTLTPTVASPTPKPLYQGFVTYNRTNQTVTGYDFNGKPLPISLKATGAEWIGFNRGQWANDSFYYVKPSEKNIVQVAKNGAVKKLAFVPAKDDLCFIISNDGKRIAWSFSTFSSTNPSSELWVGNLDGTNLKQVAKIDVASNSKWLVLHPLRWLPDGRLLYIDEPSGIGGYILFYGFAGLHLYDPASSKLANLTPGTGAGSLCLSEISPDLKTVASTCAVNQTGALSYISLDTNKVMSITRQADQNQVGSAMWSPSGAWMAYAYARANASNELGSVALIAHGATTPRILSSLKNGYYNVVNWINDNQFLVQSYEGDLSSIWLFSREGGNPLKLADGTFISVIPE